MKKLLYLILSFSVWRALQYQLPSRYAHNNGGGVSKLPLSKAELIERPPHMGERRGEEEEREREKKNLIFREKKWKKKNGRWVKNVGNNVFI